MGTDLTTTGGFLPGLLPAQEAAAIARSFTITELEWGEKFLDRLPNETEREVLGRRQGELATLLTPAREAPWEFNEDVTQTPIGQALAALFALYTSMRNANIEEQIVIFHADLCDVPSFAIAAAVDDIRHNRVFDVDRSGKHIPLNMDHPPSSVRIRAAAEKHLVRAWADKLRIDNVLTCKLLPPPLPDAEREQMAQNFRNLAHTLDMRLVTQNAEEEEKRARVRRETAQRNSERIEEQRRSAGLPPTPKGGVLVSPSLAAKVAQWRIEDDEAREQNAVREARSVADRGEYREERAARETRRPKENPQAPAPKKARSK